MRQTVVLFTSIIAMMTTTAFSLKDKKQNKLAAQEKKQGWKLLFDGRSFNGWRPYQNKKATSWSVKDDALYCKGSAKDKYEQRSDLITTDVFENFEFSVDWKLSSRSNSGIIYLFNETEKSSYLTGPEYQIIDDKGYPGKLEDWQTTASNYAMHAAKDAVTKPVGEWNNTKIVVNKGHVEHWLNGKKVVEYELGTDEWNKKKSEGKWKDSPSYGTVKKGHIALQDHGDEAWFRNIKIRIL